MGDMLKDPRFSGLARDPKFKPIPKKEKKIEIDERFKEVFTGKKFQINSIVDKRGAVNKPVLLEGMEKFYHYSNKNESKESDSDDDDDNDDNDDDDDDESNVIDKKDLIENKKQLKLKNKKVDGKLDNDTRKKLQDLAFDYARGEKQLFTDSSSDDSSDDDDDVKAVHDNDEYQDEEIEHKWGELDKEADTTETITSRLAACNMDWDRIRAIDLMVLFNSFLQAGGFVHSVNIYPSEYGLKRLQEEEIKGPIEVVDSKKEHEKSKKINHDNDDNDDVVDSASDGYDSQNEEGSAYTMEKMRQYQLNRLKYYYAVIKFDSPGTANKIYTECDGIEYESTSTKLDLRFIPDDMEFDQEPKETCDKLPDPTKYMPRLFTTTALQQVKVDLTWDENNPERQEIAEKYNSRKIDEIDKLDEVDIHAYLGSGSSDDEEELENENEEIKNKLICDDKKPSLNKYRSLIQSIKEKDEEKKKKDVGIEFTWSVGVKEKADKTLKDELKKKEISKLSVFQQKTERIKEQKKLKKQGKKKLKQQKSDADDDDDDESDDSVPSDIDMNDPYFAEELKNLQPKKNNNKVDKNKKKKKNESDDDTDDHENDDKKAKEKAELELLLLNKDDQLNEHHFDMKKIEESDSMTKSKRKRLIKMKRDKKAELEKEDTFEVDVADTRFAALYHSHHFNIDPADPHYRKTKGTEKLIQEKLKRRAEGHVALELPPSKISKESKEKTMSKELEALVKSVKRNTKNISQKIK